MKLGLSRESPRALWLSAFLVLGGGCSIITEHYEAVIKTRVALSEQLEKTLAANQTVIARRRILERLARQIKTDFVYIGAGEPLSSSVTKVLGTVDRLAAFTRVSVGAFEVQAGEPKPGESRPQLLPVPATIRVSGDFNGLLRFIQELPRQHVLIGIEAMQLGRKHRNQRRWYLDAEIHAALYQVRSNLASTVL